MNVMKCPLSPLLFGNPYVKQHMMKVFFSRMNSRRSAEEFSKEVVVILDLIRDAGEDFQLKLVNLFSHCLTRKGDQTDPYNYLIRSSKDYINYYLFNHPVRWVLDENQKRKSFRPRFSAMDNMLSPSMLLSLAYADYEKAFDMMLKRHFFIS